MLILDKLISLECFCDKKKILANIIYVYNVMMTFSSQFSSPVESSSFSCFTNCINVVHDRKATPNDDCD